MRKLGIGLIALVILFGLMSSANAVLLVNENGTGICFHPSQSHAYFWIPDELKSATPVVIDSTYIELDGVQFEVIAEAPVDVYIYEWNPEEVVLPGEVVFNFTVNTTYHNQTVTFYIGNLTENIPLIVYKDGEPFYIMKPSEVHSFRGNVTVNTTSAVFSDGYGMLVNVTPKTNISQALKLVNEEVSIKGKLIKVEDGKWVIEGEGGKAYVVSAPTEHPIDELINKEIIVKGRVTEGKEIEFKECVVHSMIGTSSHNYVIKTFGETAIMIGPVTIPSIGWVIGWVVIVFVLVGLIALGILVYRKYRGM